MDCLRKRISENVLPVLYIMLNNTIASITIWL